MQFLLGTILVAVLSGLVRTVTSSPASAWNQTEQSLSDLTKRAPDNYEIDCTSYPNVCENQCYYVYCKSGAWDITVQRTPASRRDSECAGYNRCSSGRASGSPAGGWAVNGNTDWSCDEQPKSSTGEGGVGSATRCMPKGENSGEGATWQNFINGNTAATKNKRLADGSDVMVVLKNADKNGYCASYVGGKTKCGTPATPPGTGDGPRQR